MKLFTVLLAFGAVVFASDKIRVPGENPLTYCDSESLEDDILTIDFVDLDPNPPLKGKDLEITASGTLNQDVEKGAYALVSVSVGPITILKLTSDICEEVKKVDRECPLEKGPISFKKTVQLPAEIPPAKFIVRADVFTKDQKKITCMEAVNIEFKQTSSKAKGFFGGEL